MLELIHRNNNNTAVVMESKIFMEREEEKIGVMEAKGPPTRVIVNLLNGIIVKKKKEAILKKIDGTKIRILKCSNAQIVTNLDMLRKTAGIKVKIKQIFMKKILMTKLKKTYSSLVYL